MQLVNFPVALQVSDYEHAFDAYLARIQQCGEPVSVYTMGSVRAPGLSDLDVIVCVADDFPSGKSHFFNPEGIDDRIFLHGPIVLPLSLAQDLQRILFASDVTHRAGPDILKNTELGEPERRVLKLAITIDFLESRMLQWAKARVSGDFNVRAWVTRMWSLTHSQAILLELGGHLSQADECLLNSIRKQRKTWQLHGQLPSDVHAIWDASEMVLYRLFSQALDLLYGNVSSGSSVSDWHVWGDRRIRFHNDEQSLSYQAIGIPLLGKILCYYRIDQSFRYLNHLSNYGLGYLNVAVKDRLPNNAAAETIDMLRRRSRCVQQHWDWMASHVPAANADCGYLGKGPTQRQRVGVIKACMANVSARVNF